MSFFPSGLVAPHARQTRRKKGGWVRWHFTQGGGLSGLALGYYLAARSGAPEPSWRADNAEELVVVVRTIGFKQGRVFRSIYHERSVRPA